ncbi:MAG: rhodanese-like domain-containing protein [Desulfobacterales bacterium]|nr:rhodanese-like domain-containing protein [Desulfobacterales bacterium]
MDRQKRSAFKQSLWQMPAIIAVACLIGLAVNQFRPDGIALVGDWSQDARFLDAAGDSLVVSIETAEQLFRQERALFVDARSQREYAAGHIRGALSIPWQEVDRYFIEMVDRLEGPHTIITYCDGETCDLSHDLALFLKEMGFENVRVLVNGWTVWKQGGLPTDEGG